MSNILEDEILTLLKKTYLFHYLPAKCSDISNNLLFSIYMRLLCTYDSVNKLSIDNYASAYNWQHILRCLRPLGLSYLATKPKDLLEWKKGLRIISHLHDKATSKHGKNIFQRVQLIMKQELVCKNSQSRLSNKGNLEKAEKDIDRNGCNDHTKPIDKENVVDPFSSPPHKLKQIIPSGWHIPRTPLNEISRSKTVGDSPCISSSLIPPPPAFEDTANFIERKDQMIPKVVDSGFLLSPPSDFRDNKKKACFDDVSTFSIDKKIVKELKPSETSKSIHMSSSLSPQLSCNSAQNKPSPVDPSLYHDPHPKSLHQNKNYTFIISKSNSPIDNTLVIKEKSSSKMVNCHIFNEEPLLTELDQNLPSNALDTIVQTIPLNCITNTSFLKQDKDCQQSSYLDFSPDISNLEHSITGGKIPKGNDLPRTPPHNATFSYENKNKCQQDKTPEISSHIIDKNIDGSSSSSSNLGKSEDVHSTNIETTPQLNIQDKSFESFQELNEISANNHLSCSNMLSDDSLEIFISKRTSKFKEKKNPAQTCLKEIAKKIIEGKDLKEAEGEEIGATIDLQKSSALFNLNKLESEANQDNKDSTFVHKEIKQPNALFEALDKKCPLVKKHHRIEKDRRAKLVKSKTNKENASDSSFDGKKNDHEQQNKEIQASLNDAGEEKIMENTQTKLKRNRVQKLDNANVKTKNLEENTLEDNEIKGIIDDKRKEEKCEPFKEIEGNIETKPKRTKRSRSQSKKGAISEQQKEIQASLNDAVEEKIMENTQNKFKRNRVQKLDNANVKTRNLEENTLEDNEIKGIDDKRKEEKCEPFKEIEGNIETKPKRTKRTQSKKEAISEVQEIQELEITSFDGKKNYHEQQKEIQASLNDAVEEKIMENTQNKFKRNRVQKLDNANVKTRNLEENTLEDNEIKGIDDKRKEEKCEPFKEIEGNIETKPKRTKRTQSKKEAISEVQEIQELEITSFDGKKNYHEQQKEIQASLNDAVEEKIMENTQTKFKRNRVQKLDNAKVKTQNLRENTLEDNEIKGIIDNKRKEDKCEPFKEIEGNIETKRKQTKRTQSKKEAISVVQEIQELEIRRKSNRNAKNKKVVEKLEVKTDNVKRPEINTTKEIININEETFKPVETQEKSIETKTKQSKRVSKRNKSANDPARDISFDQEITEVERSKKKKRDTKVKPTLDGKIELKNVTNMAVISGPEENEPKRSKKSRQNKFTEPELNTTLISTKELKGGNKSTCDESKISPKPEVMKGLKENTKETMQRKSKLVKNLLGDIQDLIVLKPEEDCKKPRLQRKKGLSLKRLGSIRENVDEIDLKDSESIPLSQTNGDNKVKLPIRMNSLGKEDLKCKVTKKEDKSDKDTKGSDQVREKSGRPLRQSKARASHAISLLSKEKSF